MSCNRPMGATTSFPESVVAYRAHSPTICNLLATLPPKFIRPSQIPLETTLLRHRIKRELFHMLGKRRLPLAILMAAFALTALPQWLGQNYLAKAQATFTIGVKITEDTTNGPPISGVSVLLVMNMSTQFNCTTDSNGECSFTGISGSYEVTPSKPGYLFNPTSQGGTQHWQPNSVFYR